MRRGGTWLALASAVLALAACGGDDDATTEEPGLARAIAERLANESEAIADKLDAGDVCGAAQQADVLVDSVAQAIADGDIPEAFQAELTTAATNLQNDVNCPQAEPPPPAVDCDALEEEKKALEEEKEDAEGDEAEELDQQIKELDQQLKECGKNGTGQGDQNGEGEG
jgi:hypothetical protein